MKYIDVVTALSKLELANLDLSEEGTGNIKPASLDKLLIAMNDCLLLLHAKYRLKIEMASVALSKGRQEYSLGYYKDWIKPLFMRLESDGVEHWINAGNEVMPHGATVRYNKLKLSSNPEPDTLHIAYQAKPVTVTPCSLDCEVELPDVLIPPLRAYVASAMYSSMNSIESVAIANRYEQIYQNRLSEVTLNDSVSDSRFVANNKLYDRGFV